MAVHEQRAGTDRRCRQGLLDVRGVVGECTDQCAFRSVDRESDAPAHSVDRTVTSARLGGLGGTTVPAKPTLHPANGLTVIPDREAIRNRRRHTRRSARSAA